MSLTGSPSSLPITCAISPLHLASSTTPHRLLIFSLHISDWLYTIHTISVLLHLLCNVYHFTSSSYWILYMYVLMIWNLKENPCIHLISQSNRMFSCKQHCNIVPQYCNFGRQIALSNLQATRTNCKLKFTKDLYTKPLIGL
jgi:hypothetical protein